MQRLIIDDVFSLTALLFFILTGYPFARAQQLPQPNFITDQQGLPQAFVPSIVQDRQGFIWAATRDGLCRYDGRQFKVFQPDPDGRPSLSFAGLVQLVLDQRGHIWIMSDRGDIDRFDPRTETFTNFSRQPAFRRLARSDILYRMRIDRKDRLWLSSNGYGIICWNLKTNQGRWFHHQANRPASISSNRVYDVVEGADNAIWLATSNGLDRFEETTQHFTHFRHHPTNPQSIPDNFIIRIQPRPNGELILVSRHHLTVFQPRTGQVRPYQLPVEGNQWDDTHFATDHRGGVYFDQNNILYRFTDQEGPQVVERFNQGVDNCASLFVDQTDVLWIGTDGSGIRTYDLRSQPFRTRRYQTNFYADLLTSNSLGLPSISPSALSSLSGLVSYNFRSTFDQTGRLWFNVGSSDVYRLDLKRKQTDHFPLPVTFRALTAVVTPCPMATDPQGRIWAVYDSLAFWYDEQAARWIQFPLPAVHRPASPVTGLVVDEQALWLASWTDGLWRLDRRSGQIRQFANRSDDPTSLSSNALYCVSADPTNANLLWIGTFGNGLCRFDKRTGKSRRFSQSTGLPNNVVYSALPDQQGYLWMGTNKGLCRMNRRTFVTQTYTRGDGILADEFNSYHYLRFPDGTMLLGGLEGFTVFDPRQIVGDRFEPTIELTELQVNNQRVVPDQLIPDREQRADKRVSPLGQWPIQATQQITLPHNQNYVTVQFAAIQFNQPAKNRFRYRLEGLETNWTQTDQPQANYTNLPPGQYVLILNATNTSGLWSRHVRRLGLTIRPPIWATWWAIGLYGLALAGLGFWLIRAYLNRFRLRQAMVLQQRDVDLKQKEADQLRAVDTLKTNFFTNITHEFRTPLTLILAPAQQMMTESRPEKDLSRLATIDRQTHQLLRLINQMLDFSKLEAGALPVLPVRGEPGELMGEWVGQFALEAQTRNIRLFCQPEPVGTYWFDLDKLERIVTNLLSNAVKFTPSGGHIQVGLTASAPADGVLLTVADSGVGIPADALPHIFERFYQVDDLHSDHPQPGTGIGLAMVHDLVVLQGGTITVQSKPGQGTQFTVWLPYQRADSATDSPVFLLDGTVTGVSSSAPPAELPTLDGPIQGGADGETPVVLIVEDNAELADFIADSLPPAYQIHRAVNGQQGFEQALTLLPDLVISDVMMPVLDGYGFCQLLKKDIRTNHVPIILLTAKSALDSRLEGLSRGADDYLIKPFHVRELQLRVGNLLEQRRRLRERVRASLTVLDEPPHESVPAPTDPFIAQIYTQIEAHLDRSDFGVEQLATQVGMSRSYLFRKVKALTGLSASELERNYRLKRATHYLQQGHAIAQTGYLVGFETPAYFTQSFRKLYGITPTDYLAQQSRSN